MKFLLLQAIPSVSAATWLIKLSKYICEIFTFFDSFFYKEMWTRIWYYVDVRGYIYFFMSLRQRIWRNYGF